MGMTIDEFVGKLDKMAAAYGSDASDVLENGAGDMRKALRNTAPHFHLVNRGVQHPKDPHGKEKPEWLDALNKHVGFMQRAVEENWPGIQKKMAENFYEKVRGHLG